MITVTHGCIIAVVTLVNPDGSEALGYVTNQIYFTLTPSLILCYVSQ